MNLAVAQASDAARCGSSLRVDVGGPPEDSAAAEKRQVHHGESRPVADWQPYAPRVRLRWNWMARRIRKLEWWLAASRPWLVESAA